MSITFYAPEWGNTLPFDAFCQRVKAVGYDGVEMALPLDKAASQTLVDTLRDHDLEWIGQYYQSFERDMAGHSRNYETIPPASGGLQPRFYQLPDGQRLFYLRAEHTAV